MLKKKIFLIGLISLIFLTGCAEKTVDFIYTLDDTKEEVTEEIKENRLDLDSILTYSKTTLSTSKKYEGEDFKFLTLTKYSSKEDVTLEELCNNEKPTVLFLTSVYCATCSEVEYQEVLSLNDKANFIIITFDEDEKKFKETGLYDDIYMINYNKLMSEFTDDKEEIELAYQSIINALGTPSSIYINSDNTFAFTVNGTRVKSDFNKYIKYLY